MNNKAAFIYAAATVIGFVRVHQRQIRNEQNLVRLAEAIYKDQQTELQRQYDAAFVSMIRHLDL